MVSANWLSAANSSSGTASWSFVPCLVSSSYSLSLSVAVLPSKESTEEQSAGETATEGVIFA